MLQEVQKYNKFLVALLGAVVGVVYNFYGDNQWVQLVVAVLTALGVYQIPNRK